MIFEELIWTALLAAGALIVLAILLRLLLNLLKPAGRPREFGHIYVISNPVSLGSDVWKIGLTRKSDPHDRIKRGNTYVPFDFVVNALVESKDVNADEKRIHGKLRRYRMNLARPQREFFRAPFSVVTNAIDETMPKAKWLCRDESPEQRDYIATKSKRR